MSTHDYNLANQSGASFRSDLNNALAAILSNNSNASSPTTTVAYMLWVDTTANKLKIRNSANSAWIDLIDLDGDITRDFTFNGTSANIDFDTSDNELNFKDNAKATFGNSADLTITHDGGSSIINDTGTGELLLQRAGDTMVSLSSTGIVVQDPGSTAQVEIKGFESSNANLLLKADEGDDNGDTWLIQSQASTQDLKIYNDISGSNVEKFAINNDGDISITGHVSVDDDHDIRLGNGNDFILIHDTSGTDANIINCANDHDLFINHGTENMAIFRNDADVELFYDGTKRFETLDTGVHLIGTATTGNIIEGDCRFKQAGDGTTQMLYDSSENHIKFVDNVECVFGSSSDLKIRHDTTGSSNVNVIDSGPNLEIRHGTETMALFDSDSQVQLYHNNAVRLATTTSGVKVTRTGGTSSDVILEVESENDSSSDAILQLQCLDGTAHARINLGDNADADNGQIDYDNNDTSLKIRVNASTRFEMRGDNEGIGFGSGVVAGSFESYNDIRDKSGTGNEGARIRNDGAAVFGSSGNIVLSLNRRSSDGTVINIRQNGSTEGSISVSGSTVSFNGGHLSRWSQVKGLSTTDKSARPTIYQGTVMSNLDDLCVWSHAEVLYDEDVLYTRDEEEAGVIPSGKSVGDVKIAKGTVKKEAYTEENQQLNMTKVSDTEGDKNVAGVFWTWDDEDDEIVNDFFVAMTGDLVIRVAASTTVARGDLLVSAGDGTAKPQTDDIIRSSTIAKIISTNHTATYADGSKAYPCVLMAC
tara:strand:- start:1632 stop:3917 length:2286 start_codon:yes stop_codon:yes gene_type:complete